MTETPDYEIRISTSEATTTALVERGYRLYVLHAVKTADRAAIPVVWLATDAISMSTSVRWSEAFTAFTSSTPLVEGRELAVGFGIALALGQILSVKFGGVGVVSGGGPDGLFTLVNQTTKRFTAGLALPAEAPGYAPVYAAPLYGQQSNQIAPSSRVLLSLSTQVLAPGTMVRAMQPVGDGAGVCSTSLVVDLAQSNQRQVAFDIDSGWSWGDFAWAKTYPANADLTKVLIL